MAKQKKPIEEARWKVLRGCSSRRGDGKSKFDVIENKRSLEIPGGKDLSKGEPYGIPITAKLGIELINRFHDMLHPIARDKFITGKYISFNDIISKSKTDKGYTWDDVEKSYNELIDILRRSCAITIDKNVLLKTLSQPNCEGIRFYLCKKKKRGPKFISLVTVGVDCEGKDHLYDYIPTLKDTNIPSKSLVTEYAHPPGDDDSDKDIQKSYPKPYVLLNYATEETKRRLIKKK